MGLPWAFFSCSTTLEMLLAVFLRLGVDCLLHYFGKRIVYYTTSLVDLSNSLGFQYFGVSNTTTSVHSAENSQHGTILPSYYSDRIFKLVDLHSPSSLSQYNTHMLNQPHKITRL